MFGVIGSIFTVILLLYIIFSVLSGNVLYNLRTEKNVYPGKTFLFGFILALIVTGSFYLDYKYNDLKGARMVIEKVIDFFNKE
jgi:hypothetical protein